MRNSNEYWIHRIERYNNIIQQDWEDCHPRPPRGVVGGTRTRKARICLVSWFFLTIYLAPVFHSICCLRTHYLKKNLIRSGSNGIRHNRSMNIFVFYYQRLLSPQGSRGPPGSLGRQGDQGADGHSGRDGIKGESGEDGVQASNHLQRFCARYLHWFRNLCVLYDLD